MPPYTNSASLDPAKQINLSHLRGKTAIVTGGASGLGLAYTQSLLAHGCHVCVGDVKPSDDLTAVEKSSPPDTIIKFVTTDVTVWEDQLALFKAAEGMTERETVDYVVANAGIHRSDDVYNVSGVGEPKEPDLSVIDVNVRGVLYTTQLALHWFAKANGTDGKGKKADKCLVLIGSGASFLDCLRAPQYQASKWAVRGMMHSLRRTVHWVGGRVNVIAPWYVRTGILKPEQFDGVEGLGVELARVEDAQKALVRMVGDGECNGRMVFVCSRKWRECGWWDLGVDDFDEEGEMGVVQREQMFGGEAEKGWMLDDGRTL